MGAIFGNGKSMKIADVSKISDNADEIGHATVGCKYKLHVIKAEKVQMSFIGLVKLDLTLFGKFSA